MNMSGSGHSASRLPVGFGDVACLGQTKEEDEEEAAA